MVEITKRGGYVQRITGRSHSGEDYRDLTEHELSTHGDLVHDHDRTSPHLKGYTCFICKHNFKVVQACDFLKNIAHVSLPEYDTSIANDSERNAAWEHKLFEAAEREWKIHRAIHKRQKTAKRQRWHRAQKLGVTREEFEAREKAGLSA